MPARQRKLAPEEAQRKALELLDGGSVRWTRHARERGRKRDFDEHDLEKVLRTGRISGEAEEDRRFQNWKYKIEGEDVEGDELAILFAFEEDFTKLRVITGW